MPQSKQTAGQFISAVHRRLVLLRCIEHIGRGMMIGSALAIVLVCIAVWQSMPTAPVLLFCAALGLLIGTTFAIRRWPTRLSAAAETDQQLRLEDLLTTSMQLSFSADDFAQAVVAMADARCRLHSPSEVVLRQLGIRSWSGIGLTMAIAATLAAIPLGPSRSQATDSNMSVLSENTVQLPGATSAQRDHGPVAHVNDPVSDNASSHSMSVEHTTNPAGTNTQVAPTSPILGNSAGASGGSSKTAAGSQQDLHTTSSSSHPQNTNGTTASGGSAAGKDDGHGEAGGGTQGKTEGATTPKTNLDGNVRAGSQTFPSAVDDRIPPEDRDLVRDFFNKR